MKSKAVLWKDSRGPSVQVRARSCVIVWAVNEALTSNWDVVPYREDNPFWDTIIETLQCSRTLEKCNIIKKQRRITSITTKHKLQKNNRTDYELDYTWEDLSAVIPDNYQD